MTLANKISYKSLLFNKLHPYCCLKLPSIHFQISYTLCVLEWWPFLKNQYRPAFFLICDLIKLHYIKKDFFKILYSLLFLFIAIKLFTCTNLWRMGRTLFLGKFSFQNCHSLHDWPTNNENRNILYTFPSKFFKYPHILPLIPYVV